MKAVCYTSGRLETEYNLRDTLYELLEDICQDEQLSRLGYKVLSALNYNNSAQLDKQIIQQLFGQEIRTSAGKLSTFACCPYKYFAQYVLQLKERGELKFRPLQLGDFYHRILNSLLKQLNKEGKNLAQVTNQELRAILADRIKEFTQTNSFVSNFVSKSRHNAFIIEQASEILEDCVLAIAEMVRAGKFLPLLSEVSFGQVKDATKSIGECQIALPDGRILSLDGKIDRLDVANINGRRIAIIFDYKKHIKEAFNWSKFYYGLDMQLPIYILAVHNVAQLNVEKTVGAFYLPIEVSPQVATLNELNKQRNDFNYKAKGIFNGSFAHYLDYAALKDPDKAGHSKFYNFFVTKDGEPYGNYEKMAALSPEDFEKVLWFTKEKIIQLAQEILSGKIDIKPYKLGGRSPCSHCEYKSVCRFDWQINSYYPLMLLNKRQVLDRIKTKFSQSRDSR